MLNCMLNLNFIYSFFTADCDYALTAGSDKSIKLWNPRKGLLLQTFSGHGYEVMDVRGSCDSSHLASGSLDKCVFFWDVSTAQALRRYRGHAGFVNCVQFNEESTIILSGSVDSTVKAWDCKSQSKEAVQVLDEAKDSVTSIAISNQEIITSSLDHCIRTYDLRKGFMHLDNVECKCGLSFFDHLLKIINFFRSSQSCVHHQRQSMFTCFLS